jgi:hypothetical protein
MWRWGIAVIACLTLAGCASGSPSAESIFIVSENDCKTPRTFTRAEVIETWGASAVHGEELRGTPADINHDCETKGEP